MQIFPRSDFDKEEETTETGIPLVPLIKMYSY